MAGSIGAACGWCLRGWTGSDPELDLAVRNLRKSNADKLITPAEDKKEERKAPLKRPDATNKGPKKANRKQKRGAEHLAEDLES